MSEFNYTTKEVLPKLHLDDNTYFTVEITEGNGSKLLKAKVQFGQFMWPDQPGVLLKFDNDSFVVIPSYRVLSISTYTEPHLKVVK